MNNFKFEDYETNIVEEIIDTLNLPIIVNNIPIKSRLCEMSNVEKKFLNGIIRKQKPKKILEIGVAAGGSSSIILNAIKDIENATLYSIDYSTPYFRDKSKKTGYVVNEYFPHLANKWKLYTGGVSAKFIEEIGSEIDICLLDTVHANPGEILDLLTIIPFLKKDSIIILHDTILHSYYSKNAIYNHYTNGTIFSCLKGEKYMSNEGFFKNIGNIGAVQLNDTSFNEDNIYSYFFLLTLPWTYMLNNEDISYYEKIFYKHYSKKIFDIFFSIILFNKDLFSNMNNKENISDSKINEINNKILNVNNKISNIDNKIYNVNKKIEKLVNNIVWWIPIKKYRDKLRNIILADQTRPDQTRPDQTRPDQTTN